MTCESLTHEETVFAISKIEEWLRIKEKHEKEFRGALHPDPSHSSLLYHLLQGGKACDRPPPVINSRPCHAVANGEPVQLQGFPIPTPSKYLASKSDQWEWEDFDKRILRHLPSDVLYHISEDHILTRHDS